MGISIIVETLDTNVPIEYINDFFVIFLFLRLAIHHYNYYILDFYSSAIKMNSFHCTDCFSQTIFETKYEMMIQEGLVLNIIIIAIRKAVEKEEFLLFQTNNNPIPFQKETHITINRQKYTK